MGVKKIGITGESGFIGAHLKRNLQLNREHYEVIPFQKELLTNPSALEKWVSSCDVIVHLAALNRHTDPQVIYDDNVQLVKNLVAALENTKSKPHILFSSSTQEVNENLYGLSKKKGRELLEDWGKRWGAAVSGLVIPNVFGPFGKPFYNSFIATFCHQLATGGQPHIQSDGTVKLIYVQELTDVIISLIAASSVSGAINIPHTKEVKVSEVLALLESYRNQYLEKGEIPVLGSDFELALFNTFRSYIAPDSYFPRKFTQNIDPRGAFVEIIRLGIGGQVSFSTTVPGITRGNHYHTRKIERFAVIKGKALIQLRKTDTDEVLNFFLDGAEPAYVDMPVWYTHNIKNIGEEDLYTIFWINEPYNPEDADTYFEEV